MKRRSFILLTGSACMSTLVALPTRMIYAAPLAALPQDYVVKAGDTLLGIALAFDVSVAAIQQLNDLADSSLIRAGQTLKIPNAKTQPDESAMWSLHIVQPGDTLSAIAVRYDVKVVDLTRVNEIADAAAIQVGQKLIIPITGRASPSVVAQLPANAPTPTPELIPLVPVAQPEPAAQPVASEPVPTAIPLPTPASVNSVNVEVENTRSRLLELHNQVRVANGVQPLAYSFVLQASAQGQTDDCAGRGSCSHIGSDGSKSSQRMARAGYAGRITGENWVWARNVDQAFDMWYTQEIADQGPHWKNILSPRYVEVGFGIAPSRGGFYMIANFGG